MDQLTPDVWKLNADSNLYFIDTDEKTVIDTCPPVSKQFTLFNISKVINPKDVSQVWFTHLHYDHSGNFDLFPNAYFFASKEEIAYFKKDPYGAILDQDIADSFGINLKPFPKSKSIEVISTPGHTIGSVCFWKPDEKILFSGDTLFNNGHGRTDFPNSVPGKMKDSLKKLSSYRHNILCPGHDY